MKWRLTLWGTDTQRAWRPRPLIPLPSSEKSGSGWGHGCVGKPRLQTPEDSVCRRGSSPSAPPDWESTESPERLAPEQPAPRLSLALLEQGNDGNRGESGLWVTLGDQEGRRPSRSGPPASASSLTRTPAKAAPSQAPPEPALACRCPLASPASRAQPPLTPAWASLLGPWPGIRQGCPGAAT